MKTKLIPTNHRDSSAAFALKLSRAIAELKHRLLLHYVRLYPEHAKVIRGAVAEAEAQAWELSFFPHLLLPDLLEARLAALQLQPAFLTDEIPMELAA
jgi:hypothetical protein